MKKILFVFVLMLTVGIVYAAKPAAKTLAIRYQPPAESIANGKDCGIIETEVTKACNTLKKNLRKENIEVQLGTFSRADGTGKLWIDGKPLEEWLNNASLCRVTSDQIVEAGMTAAAKLNGNPELTKSKSASASGGRVVNAAQ